MAENQESGATKEDNPSTVGTQETKVKSDTPENKEGRINPSAPEDSNVTPGTAGTK